MNNRRRHIPSTWPYPHHPTGPNDELFGGHPYFERHMYISRAQVKFDVSCQASAIAKTRRTPDGKEDNSLTDITEQYGGMLDRWISKYVNLAKGRMAAYILEPHRRVGNNALEQEDEIDIELQVPDFWDDTVWEPLCQAVHDYIVNGIMYELFALILPPKEHIINVKREDMDMSFADIKTYICASKPGSVHKPLQPF